MIYEIPELRALMSAIDAIQRVSIQKGGTSAEEGDYISDLIASYEDWE